MYAYTNARWTLISGGAIWGLISGNLSDQTDLVDEFATKSDVGHTHLKVDITDFSDSDYATAAQGLVADSALQPGDNISELVNDSGYLTTETDPVFVASPSYAITGTQITNWDTAYGWGDHSSGGYFKADGSVAATGDFDLVNNNILFDTAFGLLSDNGSELKTDPTGYTWMAVPGDSSHAGFQVMDSTDTYRLAILVDGAQTASKWITQYRNADDTASYWALNHTDGGITVNTDTTFGTELIISDSNDPSVNADIEITSGSLFAAAEAHIYMSHDSTNSGTGSFRVGKGDNKTGSFVEQLRVNNAGSLLIGTTTKSAKGELLRVAGVTRLDDVLYLEAVTSAPSTGEGTLARADGTTWDPGSGKGLYYYNGTSWVFLA
jgi:hypothetical protein